MKVGNIEAEQTGGSWKVPTLCHGCFNFGLTEERRSIEASQREPLSTGMSRLRTRYAHRILAEKLKKLRGQRQLIVRRLM